MATIRDHIRTIPDFPKKGIMFRDVTTLFGHPEGLRMVVEDLMTFAAPLQFDLVAGLEARGFIPGGTLAYEMGKGFVPIRKKGKLPGATIEEAYALEYGEAVMEVHDDAVLPGQKVLLIDDLLATGGTASAGIRLIERLGGEVAACAFLIDLPDLGGRKVLEGMGLKVHTMTEYGGD